MPKVRALIETDAKRYRIAPSPAHKFGWWLKHSEFADTLSQAKKVRAATARSTKLSISAIWIWNTRTGDRVA